MILFNTAYRLSNEVSNGQLLDLGTTIGIRDGVCEHHLYELTLLNLFTGIATHDAMAGNGSHAVCSIIHHEVCRLGDCACSIYHIIDKHNIGSCDITDNLHGCNLVWATACFVAEHKRTAEKFGIGRCTLTATNIRSSNDKILKIQALDVRQHDAGSIKVIYRNIEESLFLICVQVHSDETGNTGNRQHICYKFGTNGHTWFILAILTSPTEIGNNSIDGSSRSALGGINHQQKFHQVVGGRKSTLNKEHITSTNGFVIADGEFTISKTGHSDVTHLYAETNANFLCQVTGGRTRENKKVIHLWRGFAAV